MLQNVTWWLNQDKNSSSVRLNLLASYEKCLVTVVGKLLGLGV